MPPVRSASTLAQPARLGGDARAVGADLLQLLCAVPGWAAVPGAPVAAEEVALAQLGGAMSNHIFRVQARPSRGRCVRAAALPWGLPDGCVSFRRQSAREGAPPLLLRLYGSLDSAREGPTCGAEGSAAAPARLFSRDAEVRCAEVVAALGLGPRCFVLFANGRLEEFLDGSPLLAPAMRSPRVLRAVAAALAAFHAHTTPRLGGPCALFARLRSWLAAAQDAARAQSLGAARDAWLDRLAAMPRQLAALEARLQPWGASGKAGSGHSFSHNDLQHNNILRMHSTAGDAVNEAVPIEIALIDYEYALPAPIAYDIGNHWCEWAADYADAPLDGLGMLAYKERYPSRAQREAFCAAYLAALPGGGAGSDGSGCEAAAAALARAADEHALASHLLWGFWGVIQARASSVDFDFLGYATARFDEADAHARRLETDEKTC